MNKKTNKKATKKFDFNVEKIIASITSKRKNKVNRTKTKSQFDSTTWAVIWMIGAVMLIIGIFITVNNQKVINEKQQEYVKLQAELEMKKTAKSELEKTLEGSLDEYIEEYARDKLDMLKPGERVYINTTGE